MIDLSSIEAHHARLAVRAHDTRLLSDPNVWGVGVGAKSRGGVESDEVALIVLVARKLPRRSLPLAVLLPQVVDVGGGRLVPVDVVEAGPFYQHTNTARSRPAQPGTSIGNVAVTAGTFGGVVVDRLTGQHAILSNNHVLADNNQAPLGSSVVQPGPADGGRAPADTVATLTRFVPIVIEARGSNTVDAAIAIPLDPSLIGNQPLNAVPPPSGAHPGVGLLWGGDGATRSNWTPLRAVLAALNLDLPPNGALLDPAPGLALQKTGRTTERTTGRVQEIHATLRVYIPALGGTAVFRDQFTTTCMSAGGDSGSVGVTRDAQP